MPVRILHIVTYMGRGGLETMLMNYYRHVDREKIQFDFLVHRDFEADYDAEILSLGGRIYHVSRLIPWSRSYRDELKAFFRQHPEYRIVHVHQDCLSAVALECAKECGIPVRIAHSHIANQDRNVKYWIKRHYMKQIPAFATDLFACSRAAGDWMFGGNDYRLMKNAIEAEHFAYDAQAAADIRNEFSLKDSVVIGHIGRFSPQKNHDYLIDIFAACVKAEPDARLLLVGDGELRPQIEKKVKDLHLEQHVIFTGVRSDVARLLQAMDVFLFPSAYEGLPVTMVEAQAAGLPCVISDAVSAETVITSGLVKVYSLKDAPEVWAQTVLQQAVRDHEDHLAEVEAAGYDVSEAAGKLQDFYLDKVKNVF